MNLNLRNALGGLSFAVLIALGTGRLEAAKVLEAPTRMAMSGLNQVAVMEVVAHLEDGRVHCRRVADIWGEPSADEVEIRFFDDAESLVQGEHYVVVYTRYRRNLLVRDLRELDPDGARVVELTVAGPAVLPESAELRMLFGDREDPATVTEHLAAAVTLLSSDDAREKRFGLAEIGLGADLRAVVGAEEAGSLAPILKDPSAADIERELILAAAAEFPQAARGAWLTDAVRMILREDEGPQLSLATYRPALIERALETLPAARDAETLDLFVRWLPSNSPGVVKAAIAALDRFDRELAREQAMKTLETLQPASAAYRVLYDYTRTTPQPWSDEDAAPEDGRP